MGKSQSLALFLGPCFLRGLLAGSTTTQRTLLQRRLMPAQPVRQANVVARVTKTRGGNGKPQVLLRAENALEAGLHVCGQVVGRPAMAARAAGMYRYIGYSILICLDRFITSAGTGVEVSWSWRTTLRRVRRGTCISTPNGSDNQAPATSLCCFIQVRRVTNGLCES